jgi:hypothetical protein
MVFMAGFMLLVSSTRRNTLEADTCPRQERAGGACWMRMMRTGEVEVGETVCESGEAGPPRPYKRSPSG